MDSTFKKLAAQREVQIPSDQVRHNNWPMEKYSDNALDSKNLYPTEPTTPTTNQHRDIHRETITGPHPYNTPVSPVHEKPLYEYKPRPIDDND